MISPPTQQGGLVVTATVTTFLGLMPFGVSLLTLVLGGVCFFGGSCARTGLALYRKLDSNDPVPPQAFIRAIAMLFCMIPVAAVASCIVFFGAHVAKIEADAAFGGLLLIMGLRGPEGLQWLLDTFTGIFTKVLPGGKGGAP